MNPDFESKLNEFYMERVGKGDSLMTAERRVRRIKWLSKQKDVYNPDVRKLYVYIEARQRAGIKKKTIRIEMMDLEHWFAFIGKPVRTPRLKKEPSPDPFVPTPEQLDKIIRFCDMHHNKEIWLRNKLIIELFSFTGVRVGLKASINILLAPFVLNIPELKIDISFPQVIWKLPSSIDQSFEGSITGVWQLLKLSTVLKLYPFAITSSV